MGYLDLLKPASGVKRICIYVCHNECYACHWGNFQDLQLASSDLVSSLTVLGSSSIELVTILLTFGAVA
ncbi:hypothetical protein C5167_026409 [Papaver somniferum]|nr:hypothetical protein C5167_026409 [Papaver somniferum]